MKRRPLRPLKTDRDELPPLPPLDGDDEPLGDDGFDTPELPDEPRLDADELAGGDEELAAELILAEPEAGWLEGADDADDADVGDLADDVHDAETAAGAGFTDEPEGPAGEGSDEATVGLDSLDEPDAAELDDGAEGADDETFDEVGDQPPLAADDPNDDEPLDDALPGAEFAALGDLARGERPPAFALPEPARARFVPVRTDGAVLAAAASPTRVLLCGEAVYALPRAANDALDGRPRSARRVASPSDELLSAVVFVPPRAFVAATVHGRVLRSEDDGASWEPIATLGGGADEGSTGVELATEPATADEPARGVRVWARAHAGGLFESRDGGAHWEGPVLAQPVRAIGTDPARPGVLAVSSGWSGATLRATDGRTFEPVDLALPAPATLVACRGDVWAFACARGPGAVVLDGGRTVVPWPLLTAATALALVETDDGAVQLVAAVYDEAGDHATVLAAAIGDDGTPRGARRLADAEDLFARLADASAGDDDEPEAHIDALIPLDPAGRRVLVLAARGCAVLARED